MHVWYKLIVHCVVYHPLLLQGRTEMAPLARTPSVHLWFQLWATSFAGEWKRKWTEPRRNWTPSREQRRTSRRDTRNWKRWCHDWTRKWWEGRSDPALPLVFFPSLESLSHCGVQIRNPGNRRCRSKTRSNEHLMINNQRARRFDVVVLQLCS